MVAAQRLAHQPCRTDRSGMRLRWCGCQNRPDLVDAQRHRLHAHVGRTLDDRHSFWYAPMRSISYIQSNSFASTCYAVVLSTTTIRAWDHDRDVSASCALMDRSLRMWLYDRFYKKDAEWTGQNDETTYDEIPVTVFAWCRHQSNQNITYKPENEVD